MSHSYRVYLGHFLIRAYESCLWDKSSTLSREGFQHLAEAHSLPFCFFQQNLLNTTGILDGLLGPIYHTIRQAQTSGKSSQNIFSRHSSISEFDSKRRGQFQGVLDKREVGEGAAELETSRNG